MTTGAKELYFSLDRFRKDETLNGTYGLYRLQTDQRGIEANNDMDAVQEFLAEYAGSPATQRTYIKECERFHLWMVLYLTKALSDATKDDFLAYMEFMRNPDPSWVGVKCPKGTEKWRPFSGPLSETAVQLALGAIGSMFNWLVDGAYLSSNTLRLIRQKTKRIAVDPDKKVERFLEPEMWDAVTLTIDAKPKITEAEKINYERLRFIISMLSMVGSRVTEMSKAKMSDFKRSAGGWFWHTIGKGNKVAKVAMPQDMVDALMRWREALGLPPLPTSDDSRPVVPSFTKSYVPVFDKPGLSSRRINEILKEVFEEAADSMVGSADKAILLKKASAHWLRHTGITQKVEAGMDQFKVQQDARHSDPKTTQQYIHDPDRARSEEAQKHRLRWVSD